MYGYAERKASTKNQIVNKPDDGLTNQTHLRNKQINLESSSPQQPNHLYLDPVYYELDKCAEAIEVQTYLNVISTTECYIVPLKLKYPNS